MGQHGCSSRPLSTLLSFFRDRDDGLCKKGMFICLDFGIDFAIEIMCAMKQRESADRYGGTWKNWFLGMGPYHTLGCDQILRIRSGNRLRGLLINT